MQPIREKLEDKTHTLISADSQLNLILFSALMDKNNEYLVKNHAPQWYGKAENCWLPVCFGGFEWKPLR